MPVRESSELAQSIEGLRGMSARGLRASIARSSQYSRPAPLVQPSVVVDCGMQFPWPRATRGLRTVGDEAQAIEIRAALRACHR
jgi:hypothetical protein